MTFSLSHSGLRRVLFGFGLVSAFLGALTMGLALFVLRPRLETLYSQLRDTLGATEETFALVDRNSPLITHAVQFVRHGGELLDLTPSLLTQTNRVLLQGSRTSYRTGETAEETKKGIAGAVLPKAEVEESSMALRNTGRRLRALAGEVAKVQTATAALVQSSHELTPELAMLSERVAGESGVLVKMRGTLHLLNTQMRATDLPMLAALAVCGFGGLYFSFGLAAMIVAVLAGARTAPAPAGLVPVAPPSATRSLRVSHNSTA